MGANALTVTQSGAWQVSGTLSADVIGSIASIATIVGVVGVSQIGGVPFMMMITSTVGGSAATSLLMTIYTGGTLAGAGLTQYQVPAGKTLRMMGIQGVWNSSNAVGGTIQLQINAATASANLTSANQATIGRPVFLQGIISAGPTAGSLIGLNADVGPASTIGAFQNAATACVIGSVVVNGYLF